MSCSSSSPSPGIQNQTPCDISRRSTKLADRADCATEDRARQKALSRDATQVDVGENTLGSEKLFIYAVKCENNVLRFLYQMQEYFGSAGSKMAVIVMIAIYPVARTAVCDDCKSASTSFGIMMY